MPTRRILAARRSPQQQTVWKTTQVPLKCTQIHTVRPEAGVVASTIKQTQQMPLPLTRARAKHALVLTPIMRAVAPARRAPRRRVPTASSVNRT
eukprot:2696159-Pleurochrysis_carterae.AAC.2